MKSPIFGVLGLFIFAVSVFAQVSPTPVINNEMRDISSTRRRSLELERVKREADQISLQTISREEPVKFSEIRADFEELQKLENEIVKTYKSGQKINFKKISDLATECSKKAIRLDANLFIPKSKKLAKADSKDPFETKNVRDIIIELDNEIGNFVESPIFTNNKIVDSKISEKSHLVLENIIKLSETLSNKAKQLQ
jgi:hypothetical protein